MTNSRVGFKKLAIGSAVGFAAGFAVAATQTGIDTTTIIERLPDGEERLVSMHWEIPPAENVRIHMYGLANHILAPFRAPY